MQENDRNSCLGISSARPHDFCDSSLFVISTFPVKPVKKIQDFELAFIAITESQLCFSLHVTLTVFSPAAQAVHSHANEHFGMPLLNLSPGKWDHTGHFQY